MGYHNSASTCSRLTARITHTYRSSMCMSSTRIAGRTGGLRLHCSPSCSQRICRFVVPEQGQWNRPNEPSLEQESAGPSLCSHCRPTISSALDAANSERSFLTATNRCAQPLRYLRTCYVIGYRKGVEEKYLLRRKFCHSASFYFLGLFRYTRHINIFDIRALNLMENVVVVI